MANPQATRAASIKVVVVVGPAGPSTAKYRDSAKYYATLARSYGASVTEIYSPYATWSRVKAAAQGANLLIYLGHGNGYPSPYGAFQRYTKDGMGLNATSGNGNYNVKYWGEYYIDRDIQMAPNAVVILNRLCYASGNSEWGSAEPDEVDRHQARRQLRRRVPAGRRQGRLRRGDQERRRTRSGRCSRADRTMNSIFMYQPERERRPRLLVHLDAHELGTGPHGSAPGRQVLAIGHRQPGPDGQAVAGRRRLTLRSHPTRLGGPAKAGPLHVRRLSGAPGRDGGPRRSGQGTCPRARGRIFTGRPLWPVVGPNLARLVTRRRLCRGLAQFGTDRGFGSA